MSISHREAQRYIEKALDGPLPGREQTHLSTHLETCATCRDYAADAAQFHADLSRRLSALWPPRSAPPQKLAHTVTRMEAQRRGGWWRPFLKVTRWSAGAALGLVALILAVWVLRPDTGQLEEAAFNDSLFPSPAFAAEYVAIRYEFDFNRLPGEEIIFYHASCDGAQYVPPAGMLARKLAAGEPLPQCEIRPSHTLLLRPGEARDVLAVYQNPGRDAVRFRFVPERPTRSALPFAEAMCRSSDLAPDQTPAATTCHPYQADAGRLWAKYIPITAPDSMSPGTSLTIRINVEWETR